MGIAVEKNEMSVPMARTPRGAEEKVDATESDLSIKVATTTTLFLLTLKTGSLL